MLFRKITSPQPIVAYLAERIGTALKDDRKVLWLLSGGSAIKVAVATAEKLGTVVPDTLTLTLADERYGPVNHADSNWRQLEEAGLTLPGARLLPVLKGKGLKETAEYYAKLLQTEFDRADLVIALAGMGPDGHIFGIKPGSPSVDSQLPVIGYEWDDYIRLTPTLVILKEIDEVVVYAVGEEKHQQLDDLAKDLPPSQQPAQFLKQLKDVIVYNSYKGGNA